MSGWTREMDAALRKGARDLWSYGMVSEKLGVSRNAVAGRAHRLGVAFAVGPLHRSKRLTDALLGRVHSPEARAKLSAAMKAHWAHVRAQTEPSA